MSRALGQYALGLLIFGVMPATAADVYKCVTATGVVYSEKKEANAQCTVVTAPINVIPAAKFSPPPSKNSESEGGEKAEKKDVPKGKIAEQERALAEAKKALAEQEAIRIGGEQNYQKALDRLKPYQDKVAELEAALAKLREEQSKAK